MYINGQTAQSLCSNVVTEYKSVLKPLDVVGSGCVMDSGVRIYKAGSLGYGAIEAQLVIKRAEANHDGRIVVVPDRDSLALDASALVAACGGVSRVDLQERGYANMIRGVLQSYKIEDLVWGKSLKLTLIFKGEVYSSYNSEVWNIGDGPTGPTGADYYLGEGSHVIRVGAKLPSPARMELYVRRKSHSSLLPEFYGKKRVVIEGLTADLVTREPTAIYIDGYTWGVRYVVDGFTGETSKNYDVSDVPIALDMPLLYPGEQEIKWTGVTAGSMAVYYRTVAV